MKKIQIFIVDDHKMMLDGIVALLKNDDRFEVKGATTDPVLAMNEIKLISPDIVITDISMKPISGIELTKGIRSFSDKIKILALSMHNDRESISEILEVGINGYVLKNTGMDELSNALIALSNGKMFFSDEVTETMMKAIADPKTNDKDDVSLTPRELEIVKLIASELNNAQIGDKLFISERTVETHRKNIFRKTNTKSVAGLIKMAIEKKWL